MRSLTSTLGQIQFILVTNTLTKQIVGNRSLKECVFLAFSNDIQLARKAECLKSLVRSTLFCSKVCGL